MSVGTMTKKTRSLRSLHGDKRGAVLVEFIVAFMPLAISFFSFLQLAKIATAHVIVHHGAVVGARAASVISNANANTPDQKDTMGKSKSEAEITAGVKSALGSWINTMASVDVQVDDHSSCSEEDGQYKMVDVTVKAAFRCTVPLGNLICGGGRTASITKKASMPHQGARYKDGGGADCPEE